MNRNNTGNNMDEHHKRLKVIIVGCGLGGLTCAISCRRENLQVIMLEKVTELSEVGAGIQLPPNATRVMDSFGLMGRLFEAGCSAKEANFVLRWQDGRQLGQRPGGDWALQKFGHHWHVMHRADYQRVLVEEAMRLGAEIRLGQDVVGVDCEEAYPVVRLANGEEILGDVVVGADGLRSVVRTSILGFVKEPTESGDLAYRVTIPRELLINEDEPLIRSIVKAKTNAIWWGQNMHVVLYGVRHEEIINLVLM